MGDTQVRCALSGQAIYGKAVFIPLGPRGYGDHSKPPRLSAGGCHLPSSRDGYWPAALPIVGTVGDSWGAMKHCEDPEHDAILSVRFGASAKDIINGIVDGHGEVIGDGWREAGFMVDRARLEVHGDLPQTTVEQVGACAGDDFDRGLAKGDLTYDLIRWGRETYVKHRVECHNHAVASAERVRHGLWSAGWADVAHVEYGTWQKFCASPPESPFESVEDTLKTLIEDVKLHRSINPGKNPWVCAASKMWALCEPATVAYNVDLFTPFGQTKLKELVRFLECIRALGVELRPSHIHHQDDDIELRRQLLTHSLSSI